MSLDGSINASILRQVVNDLLMITDGIVVIKSTVVPDIVEELACHPRVVYCPEFLTENNANQDFVNPFMHVFGGTSENTTLLEKIYKDFSSCKICPVYHMTASEASFVKYGMNSFLATKVLWFNQFHDIIEKFGGNYNTIRNAIGTDTRIGHSHTMIPGHDGRKGFGSACFAKDCPAFIKFAANQDTDFTVLSEVVRVNQDIRNSYGELLPREVEQKVNFDFKV
jgi:UDPglucose 6-dehydrogenase